MSNLNICVPFLESLSVFNRIKFYESGHTYKVDDKAAPLSVTRLINIFSPVFERDKIARLVAKKSKQDIDSVLSKWELEKDIACSKGTIFHNYVDNYLANKECNDDFTDSDNIITNPLQRIEFRDTISTLKSQFKDYYNNEFKHRFIHLKSEFVTGDLDSTNICGTIDNLSINRETGNLAIIDYKTNKKIDTNNSYGNTFVPPLDHINHCKLTIYSLQIGIYKYFIEKHTPYKVDTGNIIWFNEKNSTYKVFDVLNMDKDVQTMFNCYSSYYDSTSLLNPTNQAPEEWDF